MVLAEPVRQGARILLSVPSAGSLQPGESSCHVVTRSPHSCTASSGQAVHGEVAHATMLWTLGKDSDPVCHGMMALRMEVPPHDRGGSRWKERTGQLRGLEGRGSEGLEGHNRDCSDFRKLVIKSGGFTVNSV